MNRFRSILLSGLVALLMVGMVSAGEVYEVPPGESVSNGMSIYIGTLSPDKLDCLPVGATDCLHVGISISFAWLKGILN